jgi:hypothetical protein
LVTRCGKIGAQSEIPGLAPSMLTSDLAVEPGSYRDRHGRIFYAPGAVYRCLSAHAFAQWQQLELTDFFRRALAEGTIIATECIAADDAPAVPFRGDWPGMLRHERIPFVSYPYEWCFGMLRDAALLQLELLAAALAEGFVLKDGSAFNVQWRGSAPVFIDVPSFERLGPGEPWVGYRQFCQTCLYPLFLQAHKNVPFQPWLRGSIDGIEAEHCKNLMSWRDLLRPGVFTHVYLHARLQSSYRRRDENMKARLRSAGFNQAMLEANVRGLTRVVRQLRWKDAASTWSEYAATNSYSVADRVRKESFVREVAAARRPKLVWDLGCNIGHYSRIAAEHADSVVAMDSDHRTIERLYRELRAEGRRTILPLVMNLVDASPNLGWRGTERKTLALRGTPDLTLCLALVHHLVIGANIPMHEFIDWLASLNTDVVIEWVSKADPMVQTLLRNKRDDYTDYDPQVFERCLGQSFDIVRREPLASQTRTLYFAVAGRRSCP